MKPITGECPHCRTVTVHRCMSPLAMLYRCRVCNKTSPPDEIKVFVKPEIPQRSLVE